MSDLRQAAEMALEALEEVERVYGNNSEWFNERLETLRKALEESANSTTSVMESKALAQPEHEPVAWIRKNGFRFNENLEPKDGSETPLYTAPPKREWKGLTMDDKHFLLANAWNKEQAFDGFMDAIDKFLEEKNT